MCSIRGSGGARGPPPDDVAPPYTRTALEAALDAGRALVARLDAEHGPGRAAFKVLGRVASEFFLGASKPPGTQTSITRAGLTL